MAERLGSLLEDQALPTEHRRDRRVERTQLAGKRFGRLLDKRQHASRSDQCILGSTSSVKGLSGDRLDIGLRRSSKRCDVDS
jgi:hypothetical protein